MSTTPAEKPPRKFPAPCWTQDETLALIEAYRDRWLALRRGYLRTADWDAVAEAVAVRCPAAGAAKTSAQCRHKMEKLRQRYRTEKQRSLSFPGRFFSSWFFFDNMDSLGIGSSSAVGSNQESANRTIDSVGGLLSIKGLGEHDLVDSLVGTKNSSPNLEGGVDLGSGFRGNRSLVTIGFRAKNSGKIDGNCRVFNGYSSYVDEGYDDDVGDDTDFGGGFGVRNPIDGKLVPPLIRAKKEKSHGGFGDTFDANHDDGDGDGGGFFVRNPIDPHLMPPGYRGKKFGKADGKLNPNFMCADGSYAVPTGFRTKGSGKNSGNSCPNLDSRFSNGFASGVGLGLGKKNGDRGVKREWGGIAEIVSSIKLLGDGFVMMEKMKMEMAREIEKMRMEMEMKRSELILESQRQIVDAFVTVLMEKKKKRASPAVLPES
ncbi:alcohol dehydrogenase transcription factor Myb/SANT-like family protein [Actinidia rufa]|uniref:Alcohol dehydrogenase transcription factor Myb/SANT-like family protein n=1 Tax=Actinidia rufa TaxID=165716 RepID=A0A7J0GX10_9ERIC|nr:alcohol dehydrogenase transcription factor Myb/SANT-like family protein [Actinidia rufa]